MHLSAVLGDSQSPLEVLVFSAIALGLVFVGSCSEEIAQSIIFALMERSEAELAEPITRLLPVALGLLYLGKQVIFIVPVPDFQSRHFTILFVNKLLISVAYDFEDLPLHLESIICFMHNCAFIFVDAVSVQTEWLIFAIVIITASCLCICHYFQMLSGSIIAFSFY